MGGYNEALDHYFMNWDSQSTDSGGFSLGDTQKIEEEGNI